ncbi:MAG: DUF1800 domain-containing protein [Sulfurovum sp.]|nr:DUF1800 domain-containing protein [Sulfurovum sp.]
MIRKILLSTSVLILLGCGGSTANTINDTNEKTYTKNASNPTINIEDGNNPNNPSREEKKYSYIPKGEALTQEIAYKFLNMATFGATPKLAKELKEKGVVAWVNEQLNIPYNPQTQSVLRGTLEWASKLRPAYLQGNSIDDIIATNDKTSQKRATIEWSHFVDSALLNGILNDKSQLRQRVAYALSQTIIASESVDGFFRYRFQALAYYYDFLLEHAFGQYNDLLFDVTYSPAMATFLTYHGNRKTYTSDKGATMLPDENYAREVMQLFTLGLYQLNMDGMQKSKGTQFLQTYTQNDINNMSKVFTGLTYPNSSKFGVHRYYADLIHPMECEDDYHDTTEKSILGSTLPSGQSCKEDIQGAINILMKHNNIAPFISKKLIMRLTMSNPKAAYVERVARVFNDNGKGVKGDLKSVIKAILLDKSLWEEINQKHGTKIKEPYIAYIGMLRAFDVQASPKIYFFYRHKGAATTYEISNNPLNKPFIWQYYYRDNSFYYSFAQAPLYSPTVFNFYSDNFVPNDNKFRSYSFVAPELSIQTSEYLVRFSKRIDDMTLKHDKGSTYFKNRPNYFDIKFRDRLVIDSEWIYDEALQVVGGDISKIPTSTDKDAMKIFEKMTEKIVDSISIRLCGKKLTQAQKKIYIDSFAKNINIAKNSTESVVYTTIREKVIRPIMAHIIMSDEYMVQ